MAAIYIYMFVGASAGHEKIYTGGDETQGNQDHTRQLPRPLLAEDSQQPTNRRKERRQNGEDGPAPLTQEVHDFSVEGRARDENVLSATRPAASHLAMHQGAGVSGVPVPGSQQKSLFKSCGCTTQVAVSLRTGPHASEVREATVVARVRMAGLAVGVQFELGDCRFVFSENERIASTRSSDA